MRAYRSISRGVRRFAKPDTAVSSSLEHGMFGEGGNKSRNLCVDTVTQQWERSLVLTKGQSNAIYQTRETCEPLSFLCLSLLDRATFVAPFSRRCKPAVEPLISRCHDRLSTGTSDIPRPTLDSRKLSKD